MARIRTIKPEFWDDEVLASLPLGTRLLYIGLWNHADDEGRMRANPAFVRSKVFPYNADLDVGQMLTELAATGHVTLYQVDGQAYLHICNLTRHQRIDKPSPSALPAPPPSSQNGTGPIHEQSANAPISISPVVECNGVEGIGKESAAAAVVTSATLQHDLDTEPGADYGYEEDLCRKTLMSDGLDRERIDAAIRRARKNQLSGKRISNFTAYVRTIYTDTTIPSNGTHATSSSDKTRAALLAVRAEKAAIRAARNVGTA